MKKIKNPEVVLSGKDVRDMFWWYEKIQPNDHVMVEIAIGGDITLYKNENGVKTQKCTVSWNAISDLLEAGHIKITPVKNLKKQ